MTTTMMKALATMCGMLLALNQPSLDSSDRLDREYKSHDWFALIDAEAHGRVPSFFKGVVACALNQADTCVSEMSRISTNANPEEMREAHSVLAGVYIRQGEYQKALYEVRSMLAIRPNDPEAQGTLAFLQVASTFPAQRTLSATSGTVAWLHPGKSLTIPVMINGKGAEYLIDTGANVSTISDTEAERLGLEVHDSSVLVKGSTGAGGQFKIASARHLKIANLDLENVAFLVSPASQPPFVDMPETERGILGLPVLLAAGHVKWSAKAFSILLEDKSTYSQRPNLAFDGSDLIAQAEFDRHKVSLFVDSGSDWSLMYPRFTERFHQYVSMHGARTIKSWRVSEVRLR